MGTKKIRTFAFSLLYTQYTMSIIRNLDYKRIGYHILFWFVLILLYGIIQSLMWNISLSSYLLTDLFYAPTDMIAVYFTIYFLFPKFLYQRKYFLFALFFFLFLFILLVGISLPLQYYGRRLLFPERYLENVFSLYEYMKHSFLMSATIKLMIVGIASTIKLMSNWVKSQQKQKKLEKEKLEIALKLREAELKFLKTQINPHFLFNALNNLYGLTLEKSDIAPQIVLKISSLLDYMLHDCNVTLISLEKEIQSLRDYIDLQKIRYGDEANISFEIDGNTKSMRIAPLLLLPFVENAFKHGLTKNFGKGNVKINIKIQADNFLFTVENDNFSKVDEQGRHGIGLENVKKRLELQYKEKYRLKIMSTNGKYKIFLTLINDIITQAN